MTERLVEGSRGQILRELNAPYMVDVIRVEGGEDRRHTVVAGSLPTEYTVGSCIVGKRAGGQGEEFFILEGETWSTPTIAKSGHLVDWRVSFHTGEDLLGLDLNLCLNETIEGKTVSQRIVTYRYERTAVDDDWNFVPSRGVDDESLVMPPDIPACYVDTGVNTETASILPYETAVTAVVSWRKMIKNVLWRASN